MPQTSTYFADMVRETSTSTGIGAMVLAGALPGHRSFAAAVPANAEFYYSIAGVSRVDEWECGVGSIDAMGRLVRGTISTSSTGGTRVDFTAGLKTVALTVGSAWFAGVEAPPPPSEISSISGLQAALDSKLPTAQLSGFGLSLAQSADAAGARTTLALDGMASQSPANVAVTGGAVSGCTINGCVIGAVTPAAITGTTVNATSISCPTISGTTLSGTTLSGTTLSGATVSATTAVRSAAGSAGTPAFAASGDTDTGAFFPAANTLALSTGGSERARITSSGRLGIGTTSPGSMLDVRGAATSNGLTVPSTVTAHIIASEAAGMGVGPVLGFSGNWFGTSTSTFATIKGAFAATPTGFTGVGYLSFTTADATGAQIERLRLESDGTVRPGADNAQTLGSAAFRWSTLYAGTGAINTSDERLKQWRGRLSAAERAAAMEIGAELGFYQWQDAIAQKGDAARLHFGVRAQRVWGVMARHGLIDPIGKDGRPKATPYAFLCFDAYPGDGDSAAEPGGVAGGRFGVRPDQLALFLIAALFTAGTTS